MPSIAEEINHSNGITGGNFDEYGSNRTVPRAMTAFAAIAWYNTVEILVLLIFVFRRYSGLYFWSVCVCAMSITVYSTGAWMYQNVSCVPKTVSDGLMTAGWVVMIPSQSIVLWSRLHFVTQNLRLLKGLLWMIIINSVCLIIPTCVLNWGSLIEQHARFIEGYGIIEKIQMCVFTFQEVLISIVYLFEAHRIIGAVLLRQGKMKMMKQLVLMNVLIIALDLVLLSIEFCNLFMIQVTMKGMVYSVKLKVEFAVLSKLMSVVRERNETERLAREHVARQMKHGSLEKSVSDGIYEVKGGKMASPRISSSSTITTTPRATSLDQQISYVSPEDDYEGRYVRSLQQNVPADWRLSIGHEALSGPNLYEIRQLSCVGDDQDESDSIDHSEESYPGRLS